MPVARSTPARAIAGPRRCEAMPGLFSIATRTASRSDNLIRAGKGTAAALTSGYHLAFWIAAGLVVAAIVVALTVLEPEAKAAEANKATEAAEAAEAERARAERACAEAA